MSPRRSVLVISLAALTLAAACDRDTNATDAASDADRPETTTTTTVPVEPPRVVVAGDSIIYDVTPALEAALPDSGTDLEGLVAPAISKPTVRSAILHALDEKPTDVLVLMVGVWDRVTTASGVTIGSPSWPAEFARETIAPLVDEAAARGTHVVYLRPPPMRDLRAQVELRRYGDAWALYAATRPTDVTVVESGQWLDSADEFRELLPADDGSLVRARRIDGTHLCGAGAVRVAEGVIALLRTRLGDDWEPDEPAGWADGPWIERFVAGGQCPPP